MVKFENGCWNYLSVVHQINFLQRKIIICSIIYYELDKNIITDKQFDEEARQLVKLQKENKSILKDTEYGYCMKDFDGSTGFDLYGRLNENDKVYLTHLSKYVLKLYEEDERRNKCQQTEKLR